jgi:hypothetical protein
MKRLKTEDDVPAGKLKKDCGKQIFFFAYLKSLKKGFESEVGSGSVRQRIQFHTKMSQIPNSGYTRMFCLI